MTMASKPIHQRLGKRRSNGGHKSNRGHAPVHAPRNVEDPPYWDNSLENIQLTVENNDDNRRRFEPVPELEMEDPDLLDRPPVRDLREKLHTSHGPHVDIEERRVIDANDYGNNRRKSRENRKIKRQEEAKARYNQYQTDFHEHKIVEPREFSIERSRERPRSRREESHKRQDEIGDDRRRHHSFERFESPERPRHDHGIWNEKIQQFSQDCVELLRTKPYFQIDFSEFSPEYRRYFNRSLRADEHGFDKLIDLLDAIPNTVRIIGGRGDRIVQLLEGSSERPLIDVDYQLISHHFPEDQYNELISPQRPYEEDLRSDLDHRRYDRGRSRSREYFPDDRYDRPFSPKQPFEEPLLERPLEENDYSISRNLPIDEYEIPRDFGYEIQPQFSPSPRHHYHENYDRRIELENNYIDPQENFNDNNDVQFHNHETRYENERRVIGAYDQYPPPSSDFQHQEMLPQNCDQRFDEFPNEQPMDFRRFFSIAALLVLKIAF